MDQTTLAGFRTVISTQTLRPYDRYGTLVPDLEWLPLSGTTGSDYEAYLIRFKPGATSTPHEHTGEEEFFVLEGEIRDCDGAVFKVGDFVSYAPGSRHFSSSETGCLLLVVLRGASRMLSQQETLGLTAGGGS